MYRQLQVTLFATETLVMQPTCTCLADVVMVRGCGFIEPNPSVTAIHGDKWIVLWMTGLPVGPRGRSCVHPTEGTLRVTTGKSYPGLAVKGAKVLSMFCVLLQFLHLILLFWSFKLSKKKTHKLGVGQTISQLT